VDSVDPDLLGLMKRAGCWMISYGIESGSQEVLDRAEQALRWTREAGIRAKGLFRIGYPEETEKTLGQTLSFIRRAPLDEINLSFFTPYPGTEIYRRVKGTPDFLEDRKRMKALTASSNPGPCLAPRWRRPTAGSSGNFTCAPGLPFPT
jgi:anaerobic magnesium-protoporphyrin IX monomethyl ester cyclase